MIKFAFAGKEYQTDRVIGKLESDQGPVVVFVGGMHGNEPSGVVAIMGVLEALTGAGIATHGSVIGLAGNLKALSQNRRFISNDLNRVWESDHVDPSSKEHEEHQALLKILGDLFAMNRPVIVVDLHTTSSKTIPFLVVSKQERNISFTSEFSVAKVLGLEACLRGPMLNFLDSLGHRTMAFEAGQHDDPDSVTIHKAFIYRVLEAAKIIEPSKPADIELQKNAVTLDDCGLTGSFEVAYRHAISVEDEFRMSPGFQNFSPIQKGDLLATDRNGEIRSEYDGRIFMPLYQNAGEDGFFIVREMST